LVVVAGNAGAVRHKIAQADAGAPTHLQDTRATGFVEADMFRNAALSALLVSTMTLAVVGQIGAQTSAAQNAAERAYRPSFGESMTTANQPRRVERGLDGQEMLLALAARASHSHGG
jgi:hypothetical protein